ncbi:MAG: hypothetical protein IPH33_19630 [Bacteroidetes bacterium]|nr:hypothetical protein [Bacteroidota bacterium]
MKTIFFSAIMLIFFSIQIHAQQWNELNGIGSANLNQRSLFPKKMLLRFLQQTNAITVPVAILAL